MINKLVLLLSLILPPITSDNGFEQVQLGAGKFQYRPIVPSWTFSGSSGIAANNSGFTQSNPVAPQGTQIAFLQGIGAISQTINVATTDNYVISLSAAQRNYLTSNQSFTVSIDNQIIETIRPTTVSYQTYYALANITAGNHVLSFTSLNLTGGDNTAFIDKINISTDNPATTNSINDAWIGSSGKTLGLHFSSGSPTQVIKAPNVYINGMAISINSLPADLAGNEVLLFPLPVTIGNNDTVTISTSSIWQNTTTGLVKPVFNFSIDNRVGKSPLPQSLLVNKTFVPGVNNNLNPTTIWGHYWPFKNWAYKVNWPPNDLSKIKGTGTIGVYSNAGSNGVDNTSYPGPSGLWLIYWKSSTDNFSLTTKDPRNTVVTERVDLANPNAPNGYKARAFDFQRSPTSITSNIDIALNFNSIGEYSDLWIVGPGDFDYINGTPVVFDTSDPFTLSKTYTQWIPQNVGSLRWVDSSNCNGNPVSCPYPELLMKRTDTGWGDLGARTLKYGFISIGPVRSTWMYSPFYRASTEKFTAILADPITTAPPVGTFESYVFPDAGTAPLMAGLEITIDSEIMRIISVSNNLVKLYRGSNGTTPAAHNPGQVSVSGRRPLAIPANGIIPNGYTYELTTNTPHGQFTGSMSFSTQGNGWPNILWSDNSTTGRPDARFPLITGPNTLVSWIGPTPTATGAKPTQTYALDPTKCFSQFSYGNYIPPEVTFLTTAKFPNAALHVNINLDATDDFVYHYMRLIRDNFPAGRTVIVEYQNEPWNWGFNGFEYTLKCASYVGYENPYTLSYYMKRSNDIAVIARNILQAYDVKLMLNCQLGSDQPRSHLNYAIKNNWKVDRIGEAPYLSIDTAQNALKTWDDDQICDLWSIYLWYGTNYNGWMNTVNNYINDYNKTTGNNCQLMGYEGGIEQAVPNQLRRGLGVVYNPNWYWVEDTFYRWLQNKGFTNLHVYSLSQYHSPYLWGMYHTVRQKPGYGDGRYGGIDNRINPWSDYNNSVRGQTFIDWINK